MKKLNSPTSKSISKKYQHCRLSNAAEPLFFIGYGLIIFSDMYDNVAWLQKILPVIDILSICSLVVSSLCILLTMKKKLPVKNLIALGAFALLVLITSIASDNRTLLKVPFLMLPFLSSNLNSFISFDFKCRLAMLATISIVSLLGFNGDTIYEYRNGFMRNTFGMGHPNAFSFELSILCADIVYLFSQKTKKGVTIMPFISIIAAILFNIFFLGSRTNILLLALLLLIYLLRQKIIIKNKTAIVLIASIFFICLCISIGGIFLYQHVSSIGEPLDKLFSQRLRLGSYFWSAYGPSLFGQNIDLWGEILDNAYLNLIIRFGLIIACCFSIIYYKAIINLIKNHQYIIVMIIIIILFYGLSESPIYSPGKNAFLIVLSYAFFPGSLYSRQDNNTLNHQSEGLNA